MTKRRAPLSFEGALAQVAGTLGWERCAELTGQAERTVRNWSDPDTSAAISVESAFRLDAAFLAAGGDAAPFFACYAARLKAEGAADRFSTDALLRSGAAVAKESGDAIAAVLEAARPCAGDVECALAEREIEESIVAHHRTLANLKSRRLAEAAVRGPEVPLGAQPADTS